MKSTKVKEVKIYPFTSFNDVLNKIDELKQAKLFAINFRKLILSDEFTKNILNSENSIGYADGSFPVNSLKTQGYNDVIRLPGVELWQHIVKKYHLTKTFYILGATDNVHKSTVLKLQSEFPKIQIVGHRNGYFSNQDEVINEIVNLQPDIIFIALGSPLQEKFINECFKVHPAIYQGVGGSFDVYAGNVKRAPKFFQRFGLEGAYRNLTTKGKKSRFWEVVKAYLKHKIYH